MGLQPCRLSTLQKLDMDTEPAAAHPHERLYSPSRWPQLTLKELSGLLEQSSAALTNGFHAAQEYVRQVLLEKIIGESEQAALREQAAAALAAPGGLGMRAGAGLQPPNAQQAHQARTPGSYTPGNLHSHITTAVMSHIFRAIYGRMLPRSLILQPCRLTIIAACMHHGVRAAGACAAGGPDFQARTPKVLQAI